MSVCASVICVTCDIAAPGIGDFGHLGYPSLADDERCHGGLASFEYLYKGWAAIGFLPKDLEAIRAFLVAHTQHEVGLFLDGEEYADRFPKVTTTSKPASGLSEQDFVNGHFELACDRCKASFLTQMAQWLRPIEARKVSKAKLDAFTSRVLEADGLNFHRTALLLDPDSAEARRIAAFLCDHRNHSLTARTVVDAEWSALPARIHSATGAVNTGRRELFWNAANVMSHPAAVTPPLTLLWTYEHAQRAREAPLVADGFLYTSTREGEALACLSADGQERWRLDLGKKHGFPGGRCIVVAGDTLALALYSDRKENRELLIVDRNTGQVAQRTAFAFVHIAVADDGGQLIASAAEYESQERALALCDLRDPARPVWLRTHAHAASGDRSFQRFAAAAGQIYTEWGEDLVALRLADGEVTWRRTLAEFGGRTYHYPSPVSVSNDTIVLDTNSELLAFDAANGDLRWRRDGIQTWPRTVCEGVVYAVEVSQMLEPAPGTVVAIDVVTGREVRMDAGSAAFAEPPPPRPHFVGFPTIGLTHVFVNDRNGRIWALDKTTLQPQWVTRPKGFHGGVAPISVAYDNRLLVKASGGRLFCFEGSQGA